jgi:hypothetical protein
MDTAQVADHLDRHGDVLALQPEIVPRFYADGNRLGQRTGAAEQASVARPERWIGSSTPAVNPAPMPSGGLSRCRDLPGDPAPTLRDVLADDELGPRLLGADRHHQHGGAFRLLVKLLDPLYAIPFHVHASDQFVERHPAVYPDQPFGKDEAYHFLSQPKGLTPYTHLGLYEGVDADTLIDAMQRGGDHVLELTPNAYQHFGEGFMVKAGLLHRPGTALTLEVQQPSDVYAFFETHFGPDPLDPAALHPGFATAREAADAVIDWPANTAAELLQQAWLRPIPLAAGISGGQADWVFPPEQCPKFSGIRLIVGSTVSLTFREPCLVFVWKGRGTLNGVAVEGGGGPPGASDEFFLGVHAVKRGIELANAGDEPLVAFVLFAEPLQA